jgi:hypothetical protein
VSTLSILIQHSLGIPSSKIGRRNKGNENKKGRGQISLFANEIILYQDLKNSYLSKHLQQSSKIQNQFTKISSLSVHPQWTKFIGKEFHLQYAQKKKKTLVINLTKDVKDLYNENYKLLKKEIVEYYRRWKDLPCS